jgi:hypothetical protein
MAPGHFNELHWWRNRAFTPQALDDAVNLGVVLSVRTGSDFHGPNKPPPLNTLYQAYTFVHIPVTLTQWQNESWHTRRHRVNTALVQGRTVASRHGGFAKLTVNGNLPGAVLRNIPANTRLNLNVLLRPARTGNYEFRVYQNANNLIATWTSSGTANQPTSLNFTTIFPGGTHGYWLHVRETTNNLDIIYSTPIMVTSRP